MFDDDELSDEQRDPALTGRAWVWRVIDLLGDQPEALMWLAHALWTTSPPAIAADELRTIEAEIADRIRSLGREPPTLQRRRPSAFG